MLVRAVFGHRAEGLNVPHPDEGMRVYVVAYDTTKPTQITIAASAKPTTAEAACYLRNRQVVHSATGPAETLERGELERKRARPCRLEHGAGLVLQ